MALASILLNILDLADQFTLLDDVKTKLLNNPDKAAEGLSEVLKDLHTMYESLDTEIVNLLSLDIAKPEADAANRKVLYTLTGGQLQIKLGAARASCHKIDQIYWNHLSGWFSRILATSEQERLRELFSHLGTADDGFINTINSAENWLYQSAIELLGCLDRKDYASAEAYLLDLRMNSSAGRKSITDTMRKLQELELAFNPK